MRVYLSFQFKFSTTFDSNYGKRDKEEPVEERYCTLTKLGIYKYICVCVRVNSYFYVSN